MKRIKIIFFSLLFPYFLSLKANEGCKSCCQIYNECKSIDQCCKHNPHPYLAYRSQSVNAAREIIGWQKEINQYCKCNYYWSFYIAPEYTSSFSPNKITEMLFGDQIVDCNKLLIQGSLLENRHSCAWLADYLGLPQTYNSILSFCPKIQNFLVDLGFYLGLDEYKQGLYFRMHAPLVHTRWDLNMCEKIIDLGIEKTGFSAGYMDKTAIQRTYLPENFIDAMNGATFEPKEALKYGLLCPCSQRKTKLSDIHFVLGYNFILKEKYHIGLNVRTAAPTGTRPTAIYLFEPVIGNGKHWELGFGLSTSANIWKDICCNTSFDMFIEANISHLFKTCQMRSFDLKCRPLSRYTLLEQMDSNEVGLSGGLDCNLLSCCQYDSKLLPAINKTTYCVDTKIDIQADLVIKFAYLRNNWSFDIGYNFWARSGEKFSTQNCCDECCDKQYAVKGDAYLFGSYTESNIDYFAPLSATQRNATICKGLNYPTKDGTYASTNPSIDNKKPAFSGNNQLFDLVEGQPVHTSIQPILLSMSDIDTCQGPSALTHKLFVHINYKWEKGKKSVEPFFGLGGEIEFHGRCNSRRRNGIPQWGIWIKGGLSYDSFYSQFSH